MFDSFYEDIGNKIKGLAKFLFIAGSVVTIVVGILMIINNDSTIELFHVGVMVLGPIISYVVTMIIYGFGHLIDEAETSRNNGDILVYYAEKQDKDSTANPSGVPVRMNKSIQCECGELYYGVYCPVCGRKANK